MWRADAGIGPAHDEAPVRLVGQGRPDLLARDHPLVAVADGPRLDVGQVAARVGLGVALAPQLGALPDRREEARLLLGRAVVDQGRAEQPLAHDVDPARRRGPGVLLVEDDLLGHGGAPAAVLDRPAQAGPAAPRPAPSPSAGAPRSRRSRRPSRRGPPARRTRPPGARRGSRRTSWRNATSSGRSRRSIAGERSQGVAPDLTGRQIPCWGPRRVGGGRTPAPGILAGATARSGVREGG